MQFLYFFGIRIFFFYYFVIYLVRVHTETTKWKGDLQEGINIDL